MKLKGTIGIHLFLMLFVIASLTSCVSKKKAIFLQDKSGQIANEFANTSKQEYKIQPGDHLYVKIYSVDNNTNKIFQSNIPQINTPTYIYLNSYTVDPEGYIDISFINKVSVKGLTVNEIRDLVQEELSEYFKETTVVVKLVNFQVTVLGEVNQPGEFTITKENLNIFQAIGLAEGTKDFANIEKVVLIRQTGDGSTIHYLDLTDKTVLEDEFYYLMPNDVVYVEPLKQKSRIDTGRTTILFSTITTIILVMNYLYITQGIP